MGKIYEDIIDNEDEKKIQDSLDFFHSITINLEPRTDVIHRNNEIDRIEGIMNKMEYRSVLLVGDKGCGKTSIIEGYINRNVNTNDNEVYTIDYNMLCDKVSNPSEFNKAIEDILDVSCCDNYKIININNIGHLLNHRIYGSGGYVFLNKMVQAICDRRLKIIATATTEEFDEVKDDFPYILDFFTIIQLNELSSEESVDVLNNYISNYEEEFVLILPDKTSKLICENAEKYISDQPFPAKGLWLLDEVCSKLRLEKTDNKKISKLFEKLSNLKTELNDAVINNDYLKCVDINSQIESTNKKIQKYSDNKRVLEITENDILKTIGEIVGVKLSGVDKNQTQFLQKLGTELKSNVIGQDEAVDTIVKNIIRNKLGLRKTAHSMGNFIFIGSTGVGKTHLAKQIANQLYGSENNLLRFDMSEYQSEIDVNKLIGSPPGYVGYKESGQLVKKIDEHPESVVLFDEIEKAHPKIYDVLLQLLDEGFITGSDGNKVDATKSLIIFTSNIGVRQAKDFGSPVGFSNNNADSKNKHNEEIIRKALKKRFSPEFLNRLDGICYFNNLTRDVLNSILHKEMEIMNVNIMNICNKNVKLSKDVETWILDKVEKEENGARPIIRHLQQNIEEELSCMIINDDVSLKTEKSTLTAYIENDKIILK